MSKTGVAVDGILLLNKPSGMTSNALLQKVKRIFNAKKAGHTGSLDPLATGMLPICMGEATKFCQYMLDADKFYEASARLGIKTDTSDSDGRVIATVENFSLSNDELWSAIEPFKGEINQIPSMYSALKHQGRPLYAYAREGDVVERQPRKVNIYHLSLQHFDGVDFDIDVACSKGTYIRNLVEDIGDLAGPGAHITRLHRRYTAGFEQYPMYSLDDISRMTAEDCISALLPMDLAVQHIPAATFADEDIENLRQGKKISPTADDFNFDTFRIYDDKHQFWGLGQRTLPNLIKAKRLITKPQSSGLRKI